MAMLTSFHYDGTGRMLDSIGDLRATSYTDRVRERPSYPLPNMRTAKNMTHTHDIESPAYSMINAFAIPEEVITRLFPSNTNPKYIQIFSQRTIGGSLYFLAFFLGGPLSPLIPLKSPSNGSSFFNSFPKLNCCQENLALWHWLAI